MILKTQPKQMRYCVGGNELETDFVLKVKITENL